MTTRIRIFGMLFAIGVLGLISRLFFWQVIMASDLSKQAQLQYQRSGQVLARRGSIFASDGSWLTTDETDWNLFATKNDFNESVRSIANKLAPILVDDTKDQTKILAMAENIEGTINDGGAWVSIAHRVSNDNKKNIDALKINGIGFDPEPVRAYPEGSSSAHILGFVGKDDSGNDKGYFGLEGFYDLTLEGKPGFLKRESDANGTPIVFGNSNQIDATKGIDLVTNIDKTVQLTIERELKNAITQYGAKSGIVIMMDPTTGAIFGMDSYPSFDPASYWKYTNNDFKDTAISDTFEPGSIFKPLVMAAALDAKLVKPDTPCDICDKPVVVDSYEIDTWNNEYHPNSTMTQVIVDSDNVGMVFVGRKLGADRFYDYLDKLGIGSKTQIDLQGEVSLALRKKGTWSDIDVATTTFGQGIAVTPMQILRAIGAIANGGVIVKPQIVKEIKNGDWSSEIKPDDGQRVFSQTAANQAKDMMVSAVQTGEAKWAAPIGFKIAGKTGTAQIPIAGHYDPTKTIASFVGFAPADNPKFVMVTILNQPTSSIWGAETAAPLWFNIAKDLFPYFGIQPEN